MKKHNRPAAAKSTKRTGKRTARPRSKLDRPGLLRSRLELREEIERYVELFDYSPIGYVTFDRVGRIEKVNFAAIELFGTVREHLINSPFALWVVHVDTALFFQHLLRCRSANSRVETELHLRKRDGTIFNVLLSTAPTYSSVKDGALLYQTAIIDLTQRKLAESKQDAIHQFVQRWHEAKSIADIYEASLDAVITALGCDRATILLFDQQGVMRYVAGRGVSEAYCKAVDGHSPWKPKTKNPTPIWLTDIAKANYPGPLRLPDSLRKTIAAEGIVSCGYIPLLNERRLVGKFTLCWSQAHILSESDQTVALTIADQLALAIESFRATEELRRSEERFRQFAENATDVFWIVDAKKRRLEYISPVFEQMFGEPRKRILDDIDRWTELIHPEDRDRGADMLARIIEGETVTVSYRIIRPRDGAIRWIRDTGFPIRDHRDQVSRAAGLLQDITEERKRTEALQASEERFRYLVEGARDYAIFMLDPENIIIHWNTGAERVFGWTAEDAIGRSGKIVFTPEDRKSKAEEQEIATAILHGSAPDKRWHIRKDGTRIWVDGVMHRLDDPATGALRGFAKIARDATESFRAREELERRVVERTADLTFANKKLQAEIDERTRLEQQVLVISEQEKRRIGQELHDSLCQELAASAFLLKSQAERIGKKEPKLAETLLEAAQVVNANVGIARDLARGLHPIELGTAGLVTALRDLAYRASQPGKIEVRLVSPAAVRIRDDVIVLNLYRIAQEAVNNALKHAQPRQITISLRRTRSGLVLQISDDGQGFLTKRNGKGMGLEIMQHRANVIGGRLSVESRDGRGTTISCNLPGDGLTPNRTLIADTGAEGRRQTK